VLRYPFVIKPGIRLF